MSPERVASMPSDAKDRYVISHPQEFLRSLSQLLLSLLYLWQGVMSDEQPAPLTR